MRFSLRWAVLRFRTAGNRWNRCARSSTGFLFTGLPRNTRPCIQNAHERLALGLFGLRRSVPSWQIQPCRDGPIYSVPEIDRAERVQLPTFAPVILDVPPEAWIAP